MWDDTTLHDVQEHSIDPENIILNWSHFWGRRGRYRTVYTNFFKPEMPDLDDNDKRFQQNSATHHTADATFDIRFKESDVSQQPG